MMELPNTRTRDILLSNLNNGSTISTIIRPGAGCFNPAVSTEKLSTRTVFSVYDYDTEHGNISANNISKSSSEQYCATVDSRTLQEQLSNELMSYYFPTVYLGVYCPWVSMGSTPSASGYEVRFLLNISCTYSMNGYIYTSDYQGIDPIPSIVGDSSIITKPVTVSTFKGFENNIQDKMFVIPPQGITGMIAPGSYYNPPGPGPDPGPVPTPP